MKKILEVTLTSILLTCTSELLFRFFFWLVLTGSLVTIVSKEDYASSILASFSYVTIFTYYFKVKEDADCKTFAGCLLKGLGLYAIIINLSMLSSLYLEGYDPNQPIVLSHSVFTMLGISSLVVFCLLFIWWITEET